MKTYYKHIHFEKQDSGKRKTEIWSINNNLTGEELGEIKWNCGWRKYTSRVTTGTFKYIEFSGSCHIDTADFIQQLMDKRKKKSTPSKSNSF